MPQPASITPDPTDEEVAAILAALQVATPRAASAPEAERLVALALASAGVEEPPRWRWSGRWWTKPIPSRRVRP
ncbi:MAG TPA: hypothetical protein PKE56_10035 [Acidimicrobiales bacterium]|nr:hypothetical protein [Acidimicrobiales bacterium]